MNTLHDVLRFAHVIGGVIALISFWIPALTKKGSPIHRKAGRVYVRGMATVMATSLPLSAVSFFDGNWVAGTFLLYLFVITATALYSGTRALKSKGGPSQLITPTFVLLGWSTFIGGIVVLVLGIATKTWLLAGFSAIGLTAGPAQLAFIRKPPTDPRYWWFEHFGGMIGSGIAAHVAFLNFGAQRLIPGFSLGSWGMLAWFLPVIVGVGATRWLAAHYRAKFAPKERSALSALQVADSR
jgi:uncharacterized membrane protein